MLEIMVSRNTSGLPFVVLVQTFRDPLHCFGQAPVKIAHRVVELLLDVPLDVALHPLGVFRGKAWR